MSSDEIVFSQAFSWHDVTGSGAYTWGYDEYLIMDGSVGKVQCNRRLAERIVDADGAVALTLRVGLGRAYRILLYDCGSDPVVDCSIDRDGAVRFHDGASYVESGANVGPRPGLWATQSRPHTLQFDAFDFAKGTFRLVFDDTHYDAQPLVSAASDIQSLELQTAIVEPGTIIWLDEYEQSCAGSRIDHEDFRHHWQTVPQIAAGVPEDKWYDTAYRPKDHRWLEVRTKYGIAYAKFPSPVEKGAVELEMMVTNTESETQLTLGDQHERTGMPIPARGWNIPVGIFAGRWTPFTQWERDEQWDVTKPFGHASPFDEAPTPIADKVYRIRIEWDMSVSTETYRMWLDDIAQSFNGSHDIEMNNPLINGIDTIMIHPGNRLPYAEPFLYSYWGNITATRRV